MTSSDEAVNEGEPEPNVEVTLEEEGEADDLLEGEAKSWLCDIRSDTFFSSTKYVEPNTILSNSSCDTLARAVTRERLACEQKAAADCREMGGQISFQLPATDHGLDKCHVWLIDNPIVFFPYRVFIEYREVTRFTCRT